MEKELKGLKKQNKMLYSISKKSISLCEIKNTKKIKAKASNNHCNDSYDSSSNKYYSDSPISSDSGWDEYRQPAERREINILDHIVTENIKTDKNQHNDAI